MARDGTATRTRILDSAERLVLAQGFADTSVDEVVAASGSSKGAFFHRGEARARAGAVSRYAAADVEHLGPSWPPPGETGDPAAQLIAS
jgi:TetR/AcrR family transcriptional repressor of nem operon